MSEVEATETALRISSSDIKNTEFWIVFFQHATANKF